MDTESSWKVIALASLSVATGLVGIIIAMVRGTKRNGLNGSNKHLADQIERLYQRLDRIENKVDGQGRHIAHIEGRLDGD